MKCKRIGALALCIILLGASAFAAACAKKNAEAPAATAAPTAETSPEATATPAPALSLAELFAQINADAKESVPAFGEVAMLELPVTADSAQNDVGLSAEQWSQYAREGMLAMAMLNSQAESYALVECVDADAARAAAEAIATGFNSEKWVCVWPQRSVVLPAGNFVLLAAGRGEVVQAYLDAFCALTGANAEDANTFFTHI
jgi:hypothetical protein